MKTADLVRYYHTKTGIAGAIGVTHAAVCQWGKYPPPLHQLLFERLTAGRLKAETDVWRQLFPRCMHPLVRFGTPVIPPTRKAAPREARATAVA